MRGLVVRVLGPFEVADARGPVPLTAGRLRSVLAVLAMSAGRTVSVDELATAVWGERLPGNARRSLQTYAGRLRAAFGDVGIDSGAAGFALRIEPDAVDALRFVRLLDQAARRPDVTAERACLAEALELWRGEPFEGIDSEWLREHQAPRLVERYLSALERRIDLDLAGGGHGDLAAELGALTARHPLRESLWVRLLVALGQAGRYADALEAYETVRARIAAELGVDPSPELRLVHADLVAGRVPAVRAAVPQTRAAVTPRQLPARVERFAGRHEALATLNALHSDDTHARSAPVVVITGAAGVGKTTLAVRWAHQVADRFPDGQLHANLCGFGPGQEEAAEPADVLRDLLDAFNVPPERVPATVTAQASLFRSLLAGKRVLLLLDNARDADQVRPLLPSSPGCLTLVTSRNDLAGLVVTDGAHPVPLDVLSPRDARQLLEARLGRDRVAGEPDAVEAIIGSCAQLPLALAIVAARATLRPALPLAALAGELRDSHDELNVLDTGDAATSVRAVFSWSHRVVTPDAARLFRLLGLHPGQDVSAAAAASLAALPLPRTTTLLTQLQRTNLIEPAGHRPLPRPRPAARATPASWPTCTTPTRNGTRPCGGWSTTTCTPPTPPTGGSTRAGTRSHPARPADGMTGEELADQDSAIEWLRTERPALLAVSKLAADHGFDTQVWQLAWALTTFLDRQGHWHDWATTQLAALNAAERLGDRPKAARAHGGLARALTRLHGTPPPARTSPARWSCSASSGEPVGEAITHINLGWMYERQRGLRPGTDPQQAGASSCSRSAATRWGRPTFSTRWAGTTPSRGTTLRTGLLRARAGAEPHSRPPVRSGGGMGEPGLHPSAASGTTPGRSTVTGTPSSCSSSSVRRRSRRPCCATSAMPAAWRVTPPPRGRTTSGPWRCSRSWATPPPTSCASGWHRCDALLTQRAGWLREPRVWLDPDALGAGRVRGRGRPPGSVGCRAARSPRRTRTGRRVWERCEGRAS